MFLAACAQRAPRMRMVTGAVLPAFNHPLKLAGQLAMLDALCGGSDSTGGRTASTGTRRSAARGWS